MGITRFAKIATVLEQSIVRQIDKTRYIARPSSTRIACLILLFMPYNNFPTKCMLAIHIS